MKMINCTIMILTSKSEVSLEFPRIGRWRSASAIVTVRHIIYRADLLHLLGYKETRVDLSVHPQDHRADQERNRLDDVDEWRKCHPNLERSEAQMSKGRVVGLTRQTGG